MITVICGEDTAASRRYFTELKTQYTKKNYEIKEVPPQQVTELPKWMADSVSLFSAKQIFFTERLDSAIVRKRGRKAPGSGVSQTEEIIAQLAADRNVEIVDWEEKEGRLLKLKDMGSVKEFKPSRTIFKLLDSFVPGNREAFIGSLRSLLETQEEQFIFIMFYRHIRSLILAREGLFAKTVQPWQRGKLQNHARLFAEERLADIYQALYRIDITAKSGTNPHGIRKSLEILACYYL